MERTLHKKLSTTDHATKNLSHHYTSTNTLQTRKFSQTHLKIKRLDMIGSYQKRWPASNFEGRESSNIKIATGHTDAIESDIGGPNES